MRLELNWSAVKDKDRLEYAPSRPKDRPGCCQQRWLLWSFEMHRARGSKLCPDGREQRARLVEALLELTVRLRIGDHTAADTEPDLSSADLEGSDCNVQLEPHEGARNPNGARVDLTGGSFEHGDEFHRPDLRGACDRTWWEACPQQLGVGHVLSQLARHIRDEVPDTWMLLGPAQLWNRDRAVAADSSDVVAHQVHDHQVLSRGPWRS